MRHSIRRQIRFMQAYAATTTLIIAAAAASAFLQPARPQNLGEITAERINIVDADGRASIEFLDADGKVVQRVGRP